MRGLRRAYDDHQHKMQLHGWSGADVQLMEKIAAWLLESTDAFSRRTEDVCTIHNK